MGGTVRGARLLGQEVCAGSSRIDFVERVGEEVGRPSIDHRIAAIRSQARPLAPLPRTRRPSCPRSGQAKRAPLRQRDEEAVAPMLQRSESEHFGRFVLRVTSQRHSR
ncbi:MAG: hypothetical protein CME06_06285 [Gemmatimonadetes bacterium]|nr:hypothetical protein [Gemmatimonadota bacterium]